MVYILVLLHQTVQATCMCNDFAEYDILTTVFA